MDALEIGGVLRSREWSRAFRVVPRHAFVSEFDTEGRAGPSVHVEPGDEGWLEAVYADEALVICRDAGGGNLSSSSGPGVMALMLRLLDVQDGNTVLEIGTGSGYNAAVLSERLGSDLVTSVDIDRKLVEQARERLSRCGYHPHLHVADGADGWPAGAPYDRLIGTCAVWPIPPAWVRQVTAEGRIVTPLAGTGAVVLDVDEEGAAVGRYDAGSWYFMGMRGQEDGRWADGEEPETRATRYPGDVIDAGGAERSFSVMVEALVGSWFTHAVDGETWVMVADLSRTSWASVKVRTGEVSQAGPRRLWNEIEALYEQWCGLGAPNRGRFGLTVTREGQHTLWLDDPDSRHRWEVRTAM